MRKLCAGLMMSLDGVVESPDQWTEQYWAPEMAGVMAEALESADTVLLGRRTYLEFAKLWPEQGDSNPMAAFLNGSPKYVASSTLDTLEWEGSTLVEGDVVAKVRELKQQEGGNIQVPGSPLLVRSLLVAGVLDELALMIFPVVVGGGTRLFDDVTRSFELTLADATTYSTGVQGLRYEPAGK
ncbi:dihydrofolate reductase family protein [Actinomadura kijaniata]|uniref:Dihydrofolate reductase n=1 Tax=Actinomadura namibiensis TaxID=182080 RepID=A0A7W3QMX8_ACTNM|nr:dihydrofolate reductase family protein [Actinomadura namibiensis]MBA8953052.1 dihydrofolate reductase [Actinomadura namibiensis]